VECYKLYSLLKKTAEKLEIKLWVYVHTYVCPT
jgi:hypothetical protein